MTAVATALDNLSLDLTQETHVRSSVTATFAALLEEMGPGSVGQNNAPMPMTLEAWPGGRWFRDLGNGNGHLWGHVQAIKVPTLLEISGPLMMSFAVANPMAGWASAFGCQMFGNAQLLDPGTPEWEHGMTVFKYPSSNWEVGRPVDTVPQGQLLLLRPDRITLTSHFLRRDGYAARQFWDRDPEVTIKRNASV